MLVVVVFVFRRRFFHEFLGPGGGVADLFEVELLGVQDILHVDLAVVRLNHLGFGLQGANHGLYVFKVGFRQTINLVHHNRVAEFNLLDEQVRNAINPIHQWKRIRNYLFDNNVSTITIAQIEDKYVKSIKKKDFNILTTYISGKDSKLNTIITDFASSLCAKLILGALAGGM